VKNLGFLLLCWISFVEFILELVEGMTMTKIATFHTLSKEENRILQKI